MQEGNRVVLGQRPRLPDAPDAPVLESWCPQCGAPCPAKRGGFVSCVGCMSLLATTGLPFAEKVSELQAPAKVLQWHRQNVLCIMAERDGRRAAH